MNSGFHFRWDIFLDCLFQPDAQIRHGLLLTVSIATSSMLLGVVLGAFVALAKMSSIRILKWPATTFVWAVRGTPLLVQVMIIYFGLGVAKLYNWPDIELFGLVIPGNIQAGVFALGLNEAAYMAEIIRSGILSIDFGQFEAARSLGMRYGLAMRRIILPQAARVIIPPMGNNFNGMLKTTSLLVVISVPELFVVFTFKNGSGPWVFRPFELFLAAAVWYLVLTSVWALVQAWLEARYARGVGGPRTPSVWEALFALRSGRPAETDPARGMR